MSDVGYDGVTDVPDDVYDPATFDERAFVRGLTEKCARCGAEPPEKPEECDAGNECPYA